MPVREPSTRLRREADRVAEKRGFGTRDREAENHRCSLQRSVSRPRSLRQRESMLEPLRLVFEPLDQREFLSIDLDPSLLVANDAGTDGNEMFAAPDPRELEVDERRSVGAGPSEYANARGLETTSQVVAPIRGLDRLALLVRPVFASRERREEGLPVARRNPAQAAVPMGGVEFEAGRPAGLGPSCIRSGVEPFAAEPCLDRDQTSDPPTPETIRRHPRDIRSPIHR